MSQVLGLPCCSRELCVHFLLLAYLWWVSSSALRWASYPGRVPSHWKAGQHPSPLAGGGPGSPPQSWLTSFFTFLLCRGVLPADTTPVHFKAMSTASADTSSQGPGLTLRVSSFSK